MAINCGAEVVVRSEPKGGGESSVTLRCIRIDGHGEDHKATVYYNDEGDIA